MQRPLTKKKLPPHREVGIVFTIVQTKHDHSSTAEAVQCTAPSTTTLLSPLVLSPLLRTILFSIVFIPEHGNQNPNAIAWRKGKEN